MFEKKKNHNHTVLFTAHNVVFVLLISVSCSDLVEIYNTYPASVSLSETIKTEMVIDRMTEADITALMC